MAASRKSRILIADDNQTNVELLEVYLSGLDAEMGVAVDGRDTLDKVASFKPDLILLDIMMPKLSGFEVCKQLKGNPATKGIMILMVTALNELGDIERAVNAGTDDFLSKPVNKLELIKRVEIMLRLRHVEDEVERLRRLYRRDGRLDRAAGVDAAADGIACFCTSLVGNRPCGHSCSGHPARLPGSLSVFFAACHRDTP